MRITIQANGRTVQARVSTWSIDPDIVVFWFDPADVPVTDDMRSLQAYDAGGHSI